MTAGQRVHDVAAGADDAAIPAAEAGAKVSAADLGSSAPSPADRSHRMGRAELFRGVPGDEDHVTGEGGLCAHGNPTTRA